MKSPVIDFIIAGVVAAISFAQILWTLTLPAGHELRLPPDPVLIPLGGLTGIVVAACWLASGFAYRQHKTWAPRVRIVAGLALIALVIAAGPLAASYMSATMHRWMSG
jgi:hypothetical protein